MSITPTELSRTDVLRSCSMLSRLTEGQIDQLSQHCRLVPCERGEPIWINGGEVDFIGIVGTGFVKLVRSNPSGAETTLEIMGPGQIFGLLGMLAGSGCPLMAYGLTNTIILEVRKSSFLEVYEENNELKDHMLRKTAIRMHQKLDFMAKLSTGRVEERIAAILLFLADSYGENVNGKIVISVPLTRQILAEMAGTTTESAIRVLSNWNKSNIIKTEQQRISITNLQSLTMKLS